MTIYRKNDAFLNIVDVSHRYNMITEDIPALSNINFSIGESEFVSIVGQSGSGKSTLLSIISGLLNPTSGKVLFKGQNIYELNDKAISKHRNENVGFVFQNYFLDPMFSAIENVKIPIFLNRNISDSEIFLKAKNALIKVGLENRLYHKPTEMSGGECQRVAIARAIVNDPKVIFADEPTGNLDSKNGKIIIDMLSRFTKENKTVILVTHNIEQAKNCDRMISLLDGRIIQ